MKQVIRAHRQKEQTSGHSPIILKYTKDQYVLCAKTNTFKTTEKNLIALLFSGAGEYTHSSAHILTRAPQTGSATK
jgi:hypothetical protein